MENKFTDDEIIKALECCVNDDEGVRGFCNNGCPLFGKDMDCPKFLRRNAFDLINRQKAEIERLKWDLAFREKQLDNLAKEIAG